MKRKGMARRMREAAAILLLLGSGTAAAADFLGLAGIGVKDLEASKAFYVEVMGMQVLRTYELGYINEVVLAFPESVSGGRGAAIVLMNWPGDKDRRYEGNDVKLVFEVADPAAIIARVKARGGKVDREAGPASSLPGAIIGMARDPDNYVIELLKR